MVATVKDNLFGQVLHALIYSNIKSLQLKDNRLLLLKCYNIIHRSIVNPYFGLLVELQMLFIMSGMFYKSLIHKPAVINTLVINSEQLSL